MAASIVGAVVTFKTPWVTQWTTHSWRVWLAIIVGVSALVAIVIYAASEYTHRRPFTRQSLAEALLLAGFEDVRVRPFVQLPAVWERPFLLPAVRAVRALPLRYRPLDEARWPDGLNKLIRFSKEVVLLGTARNPG